MKNMLESICICTFNICFAKVLNRGTFVILIMMMMTMAMMIMIKKNYLDNNDYNDAVDVIADSSLGFLLMSGLLIGGKLRKTISVIRQLRRVTINICKEGGAVINIPGCPKNVCTFQDLLFMYYFSKFNYGSNV